MSTPTAPNPHPPPRPPNALKTLSAGIGAIISIPSKPTELLNEGFAVATKSIAQALPSFPAARLTSLAIGIPHAHVAHPPSGPPPVPPTPLPPIGPVMLGTCVQVLINSLPAARCGDLGFNPTCCGLPPIFEIFTGSSNVFIGGARAARVLDITYHCKPVPPAGAAARGLIAAAKKALAVTMKVMAAAGKVAQVASIAGTAIEAVEAQDGAAMSSALGLSAGMMAAQMAADAVAMALGAAMGKDPCVPPGTLGAITIGSPNVLIGGFPMPTWTAIVKGLLKRVKALRKLGLFGRSGVG
ncbi:MAG: PAAR domain-containing protein [Acidobacteria bacterium]|nr:PAAR domain-containing protein [Acidobacteriota bacterium]